MSRPKKATVDYFPHYVNQGKTMFTIESKYGNDGYAFWFKVLELLGGTEHHYLDCNDSQVWEYMLAKTRLNEETATNILNTCSKLNAIDPDLWSVKVIRSNNFILNLDDVYKRRDVDVISNEDLMEYCKQKYPLNGVIVDIKPQSKLKETKPKKRILYTDDFLQFWEVYPKAISKKKSFEAWQKADDKPPIADILAKIELQKKTDDWQKEKGQFIPHSTTYINQARWDDKMEAKRRPVVVL